jgi:hypothetical protein
MGFSASLYRSQWLLQHPTDNARPSAVWQIEPEALGVAEWQRSRSLNEGGTGCRAVHLCRTAGSREQKWVGIEHESTFQDSNRVGTDHRRASTVVCIDATAGFEWLLCCRFTKAQITCASEASPHLRVASLGCNDCRNRTNAKLQIARFLAADCVLRRDGE